MRVLGFWGYFDNLCSNIQHFHFVDIPVTVCGDNFQQHYRDILFLLRREFVTKLPQ